MKQAKLWMLAATGQNGDATAVVLQNGSYQPMSL